MPKDVFIVGHIYANNNLQMTGILLTILLLNPLGESSYILSGKRVFLQYMVALGGVGATLFVMRYRNKKCFPIFLLGGIGLFAVLTNSYTIFYMRSAAPVLHSTEGIKAWHEAAEHLDFGEEKGAWRTMTSNKMANLSLLMDTPSVSCWNSTVSGEIFHFYQSLGLERKIASPPSI